MDNAPKTTNPLLGHLAAFGLVLGKGREQLDKLKSSELADDQGNALPSSVCQMAQLFFDQIDDLSRRISELDTKIYAASRQSHLAARLQKIPGVGPITSMALAAFAPSMECFRQGRDFSA